VGALSHPALRWAPRLAERATVPGLLLHFMLRKRWIEEAVRADLAGGCAQVVVVGAGFDTLALRLSREYPHVRFVEVDHPATQAWKRRARAPARPPAAGDLRFVPVDLSRIGLREALSGGPTLPAARTVFVVEGLLMYLSDTEVARLFRALDELMPASGSVIFTVMEPPPDGRAGFHNATFLVRRLLARWREPFKSVLGREEAPRFLERFGFRLRVLAAAERLRERYLAPSARGGLALARGELIVVADRRVPGK
jgi:methyltransferase (TIGR00027 family)